MSDTIPTSDELSAARVFAEWGRNNSARWYVLGADVWHSRAPGHMERSIHRPDYVETSERLWEVSS